MYSSFLFCSMNKGALFIATAMLFIPRLEERSGSLQSNGVRNVLCPNWVECMPLEGRRSIV